MPVTTILNPISSAISLIKKKRSQSLDMKVLKAYLQFFNDVTDNNLVKVEKYIQDFSEVSKKYPPLVSQP